MKNLNERGFLLMEVILLSAMLIAFVGLLAGYRMSICMREDSRCRMEAVYLAEEEISYLISTGRHGDLKAGKFPWKGQGEELHLNHCQYQVEANLSEWDGRALHAEVTVSWQQNGKKKQVRLERMVRNERLE